LTEPQFKQVHSLIRKPALPFGLLGELLPQHEQVWVVKDSSITSKTTPAQSLLYSNMVLSDDQPASSVDLAILVLMSFLPETFPTKIAPYS
jgi:hypothetical protein